MKIAVYGVAKNEESNVKSWYESSKNADYHLIVDTGSTDNTVEVAKSFGINVVSALFFPWDETMAKNVAISLLPANIDYCVKLDLDQKISTQNWKEILISNDVTNYDYVEHNLVDNIDFINPDLNLRKTIAIHNRKNCYWDKYRPRLMSHSIEIKKIYLDIDIENLPGNDERFTDREGLYEDAWEREYQKIKRTSVESETIYFLEILAYQAFNFYERDMFEQYFSKYGEFINIYNSLSKDHQAFLSSFTDTFILTKALYYPDQAEELLSLISDNSPFKKNAIIKTEIIKLWSGKQYDPILNQYSHTELLSIYGNTKTGKNKEELAKKAFLYYSKATR